MAKCPSISTALPSLPPRTVLAAVAQDTCTLSLKPASMLCILLPFHLADDVSQLQASTIAQKRDVEQFGRSVLCPPTPTSFSVGAAGRYCYTEGGGVCFYSRCITPSLSFSGASCYHYPEWSWGGRSRHNHIHWLERRGGGDCLESQQQLGVSLPHPLLSADGVAMDCMKQHQRHLSSPLGSGYYHCAE